MHTVLILDSDPVARNVAMQLLADAGYSVLEASSSAEALQIVNLFKGEIHLVVIANDEMVDAAKEIAARRAPISMLLPSRGSPDQRLPGWLPADVNIVFLEKPLLPAVLLENIRDLLNHT
jgi:CheY-like chemotaxis protein